MGRKERVRLFYRLPPTWVPGRHPYPRLKDLTNTNIGTEGGTDRGPGVEKTLDDLPLISCRILPGRHLTPPSPMDLLPRVLTERCQGKS